MLRAAHQVHVIVTSLRLERAVGGRGHPETAFRTDEDGTMSSERMTDHRRRTSSVAARRAAARAPVLDIAPVFEAAAAGDQQAWETLIHQFSGLITSVTWSYHLSPADAADVAQSVWLSLFENIGRIREPQALAGWIRTVAQNAC